MYMFLPFLTAFTVCYVIANAFELFIHRPGKSIACRRVVKGDSGDGSVEVEVDARRGGVHGCILNKRPFDALVFKAKTHLR